ncbi:MAG: hypothetical protein ACLP8A_13625, partial [Methylovirgula sp.]
MSACGAAGAEIAEMGEYNVLPTQNGHFPTQYEHVFAREAPLTTAMSRSAGPFHLLFDGTAGEVPIAGFA